MAWRTQNFKDFLHHAGTLNPVVIKAVRAVVTRVLRDPAFGSLLLDLECCGLDREPALEMYFDQIGHLLPALRFARVQVETDTYTYCVIIVFTRSGIFKHPSASRSASIHSAPGLVSGFIFDMSPHRCELVYGNQLH